MFRLAAISALLLAQTATAQSEVQRRDFSVAVNSPEFPDALQGIVSEYNGCIIGYQQGKPMLPSPEAFIEEAIQSCKLARTRAEQLAMEVWTTEWPAPASPERAEKVRLLLDEFDEMNRSAGRMIAAQIDPIPSSEPKETFFVSEYTYESLMACWIDQWPDGVPYWEDVGDLAAASEEQIGHAIQLTKQNCTAEIGRYTAEIEEQMIEQGDLPAEKAKLNAMERLDRELDELFDEYWSRV